MSAFESLRTEIQSYIWEQGWPSLRPIQEAAISHYYTSIDNLILAAPTASGKTEAAFLPAISKVDDWQDGVKIIYISPLIALINDQFQRVTELCGYLGVPVTRWHGESSQGQKKRLLKVPKGILLITPESVEALFSRRPAQAKQLFSGVECVIIDELHSFLDTPRGVHLQSLLHRISEQKAKKPRFIGLSATLSHDSYSLAKLFFGNDQTTTVLVDSSQNKLTVTMKYNPSDTPSVPSEIIDDIYKKSQSERMLVFPNARGKVEEIAVRIQKRAKKDHSSVRYFSHHASVDKELRLEAEHFAKAARDELFTICCTSTLELGIDIGAVDSICQVDAASSVSSLAQRLGRSGRLEHHSKLHLYATTNWSLLQSIASTELFKKSLLEPISPIKKPFEVLFQQILSLLLQYNSLKRAELINMLLTTPCWQQIQAEEIEQLIDHMITLKLIEKVDQDLIVGLAAERIVESRNFYAHFENKTEYRVLHGTQHIGDMPRLPDIVEGVNVFLAARIWKINSVDDQTKKIFVVPANDGKPPVYGGEGGEVSHLVRQTMFFTLLDLSALPEYCSEDVKIALLDLAQLIGVISLQSGELPLQKQSNGKECLTTFAGTKINRTLVLLLAMQADQEDVEVNEYTSSITCKDLRKRIVQIRSNHTTERDIEVWLKNNPDQLQAMLPKTKYISFLPSNLQIQIVLFNILDLANTNRFLETINLEQKVFKE